MLRKQESMNSAATRGQKQPEPSPRQGEDSARELRKRQSGAPLAEGRNLHVDAGSPQLRQILDKAGELKELVDAFFRENGGAEILRAERGSGGRNASPETHPATRAATAAVTAAAGKSNGAGRGADRSLFNIVELNEADGDLKGSERGDGVDLAAQMLRLRDALGDYQPRRFRTEVFRLAGNMTTYRSIAFIKTCKCPGSAVPTFSVAKKENGLMGLVMGLVRLLEAVSSQRCGCQGFRSALARNGDALVLTAAEVCRIAEDSEPVLRKLSHGDLITRVQTVCQKIKGILDEILSDGAPKGASAPLKNPRATQFNIGMAGKAPDLSVKVPLEGAGHVRAAPRVAGPAAAAAPGGPLGAGVFHHAYNIPSRGNGRHPQRPCGGIAGPGHAHGDCHQ
ncbi:uncharacterized protein LOC142929293 [Petromyzon marinus]|uniref:uncharacterized protein LOC142929293 n=1 Tax=Petromyzon marinus TaxID=7757 RepID=UPI003F715F7D